MRLPALPGLWHHGDFRRLWVGQTISQFGTQITILALPLLAAVMLDASPLEMGVLGAAEIAPFLLIGLPTGVWVDRRSRRPLLIAGDFGRALALASIPLAHVLGVPTIWQLYAVAFAVGILTVFFDVAHVAYLPTLVERAQLVEGNSKLEVSRAAVQVAGPGIAGTLMQVLTAPVAIIFDAASFLVSALFLILIRRREQPTTVPQGHPGGVQPRLGAEIGDGLRWERGRLATFLVAPPASGWGCEPPLPCWPRERRWLFSGCWFCQSALFASTRHRLSSRSRERARRPLCSN